MRPTGLDDGTQSSLPIARIPLVKSGELTLRSSFVPPGPDGAKARPLFEATKLDRIRERYLVVLEWETDEGEYGSGTAVEFDTPEGTFWLFQDPNSHLVLKITPTTPPRYGVFSRDRIDIDVQLQVQDRLHRRVLDLRPRLNFLSRGREPRETTPAAAAAAARLAIPPGPLYVFGGPTCPFG